MKKTPPASSEEIEIGRLVRRNRETGEISHDVPMYASDWPFVPPLPSARLWRYGDWYKFEDLVLNRRLYFRRSDKQTDKMEGRYSEANRRYQTDLWRRFNERMAARPDAPMDWEKLELTRHRVFLSCWNKTFSEAAKMWDEYTEFQESVAFRTTAHLLNSEITKPAYQLGCVRYAGPDVPRPEYHSLAPFMYKDPSFAFEDEVRTMIYVGDEIQIHAEQDFFRYLPIRPENLIEEVVIHPKAPRDFQLKVRELCAEHLPEARVRKSVLPKSTVR